MDFELYLQAKFDRDGETRIVRLSLDKLAIASLGEKQTEPPVLQLYDGRGETSGTYLPVFREPVTAEWLSRLRTLALEKGDVLTWSGATEVGVVDIQKPQRILDWLDDRMTPRENVYYGRVSVVDDNRDVLRRLGIPVADFDHKTREFVVRVTPEQLAALDPLWGNTASWSLHMVPDNLISVAWRREAIAEMDDETLDALRAFTQHRMIETGGRLTANESVELDFAMETLEFIEEEKMARNGESGAAARPMSSPSA